MTEELSYLIGLWKADKCSTAKGIVGIRSKDSELIQKTKNVFLNYFPESKLRFREVIGYGKTNEVYLCSYQLRKFFEEKIRVRSHVFSNQYAASFLAGIFDGDGSVDPKSRTSYIAYGWKDIEEIKVDKNYLKQQGFESSINKSGKAIKLNILKPTRFLELIFPHVVLPRKRDKIVEFLT